MPKTKTSLNELLFQLDRPPSRERMFEKLRKTFGTLAEFYGFGKMTTSVLDSLRYFMPLIKAGLLDERPPIFCKTKAREEVFLRPSGALSVMRAYHTHKMSELPHPLKVFFEGESFFRRASGEERLGGRYEWGLVMIGEGGPIAEAELLQIVWKALDEVGIDVAGVEVRVNATGCVICRPSFRSAFLAYFRSRGSRLCKNCRKHLKFSPTNVFDCEEEKCRILAGNAPQALDFLCEACKKHLRSFLEFLDEGRIPYLLDPRYFRAGSWFGVLLFEFVWGGKDQVKDYGPREERFVLAEGGRMSRAGELMVGKKIDAACAVVFFETLERVFLKSGALVPEETRPRIFLTHLGELAKRKSLSLIETLRANGIEVRESLGRDSIKSQLKVAEKVGVQLALILGQKESIDGTIIVREMDSGIQETIPQEKLIEFLKAKLRK